MKIYCGVDIKHNKKLNEAKTLSNLEQGLDPSMIPVEVVKVSGLALKKQNADK